MRGEREVQGMGGLGGGSWNKRIGGGSKDGWVGRGSRDGRVGTGSRDGRRVKTVMYSF